jgi:hypothetical protein
MQHLKTKHKKQFLGAAGQIKTVGPMDVFIRKISDIEKQLVTNPNVSDDLIREAIENFILSETGAFTVIESEAFLTILRLCLKCKRDNVFIPKADALRNGIIKRVSNMKEALKSKITKSESAVHLCLDMWTSTNMYSFIAITRHYVDSDWTLVKRLFFFKDTTDHTGVGIADIVKSCLDESNISSRLGCITMDNASKNDTLVTSLSESQLLSVNCVDWNAQNSRIRCLPHIINLAVKSFCKCLGDDESGRDMTEDDFAVASPSNILKRLRYIVKSCEAVLSSERNSSDSVNWPTLRR